MWFGSPGDPVTLEFRWEKECWLSFVLGCLYTKSQTCSFFFGCTEKNGINRKPPQKTTAAWAEKQPKAGLEPSEIRTKCLHIPIKFLVENQQHFQRHMWNNHWRETAVTAETTAFSSSIHLAALPMFQMESLQWSSGELWCGSLSAQKHMGNKDLVLPKSSKILCLDIVEKVTRKIQGWGCRGPLQEKICIFFFLGIKK